MTVLDEILAWSSSLGSSWVRDALRRIVGQAELSPSDIDELVTLCKKPHGLSGGNAESRPLTADHLTREGSGGAVSLVSLTHVSDVNALAPNETVAFGRNGLTIVYGDNGAGKSGYARILKRACRARGSGDAILANALSDHPAGTPTAKIALDVAGSEQTHMWKDGSPGPQELGAVSVFDASAAQVHVSDRTEVRFRPLGLDIIDRLANACGLVRDRIEAEKKLLESQAAKWPELPRDTEAQRLLASLTALTPREEVDRLAAISEAETREMALLADVLATARAEDPAKKARELKLKAGRLRRLAGELRTLERDVGADAVEKARQLRVDAVAAAEMAERSGKELAKQASLAGVGSPEWRQMWDQARIYSERHAYAGHSFPHVETGAACVLCQQSLDPSARARLTQFEEFVKGQVQRLAAAKRKEAGDALDACLSIVPGEQVKDALDELAVLDSGLFARVSSFLDEARAIQAALRQQQMGLLSSFSAPPTAELDELAGAIGARAVEVEKAADPTERNRAAARHAELEGRKTLAALRPQILSEIERRARLNAYDACLKDTDTRALTKLGTELTKKYVTDSLIAKFDEELKLLRFDTLELELRPAGAQKGVVYHQIHLKHATKAVLPRVVSEGEARCIALAAFLAEARGAPHASAIVFDDPVSSLDHRWRTNVARRLVEVARSRQVIVFTHEMFFLATLLQEAEQHGVEHRTQQIHRGPDSFAGRTEEGLPWAGLPTKKRIAALKDRWQAAEKTYRNDGEKVYEPIAVRMYADLRRTWERAIEEVLLNGVVVRFRQSIETNRLKEMGDITGDDLKAIEAGMTKSSKWEGGHDHAAAASEPVPAPAELQQDIEALENWASAVRKRRG
jgi:energy-coupling factor transporter ATP-binding protein EcfA2